MAAKKRKKPRPSVVEPPKIHEATLASGPSGAVIKGAEIDLGAAIARRQTGENVVVCGNDVKANGRIARQIETAVGPAYPERPHNKAGPHAMPHFQQQNPPPVGHTFYGTGNAQRKARRRQP